MSALEDAADRAQRSIDSHRTDSRHAVILTEDVRTLIEAARKTIEHQAVVDRIMSPVHEALEQVKRLLCPVCKSARRVTLITPDYEEVTCDTWACLQYGHTVRLERKP